MLENWGVFRQSGLPPIGIAPVTSKGCCENLKKHRLENWAAVKGGAQKGV